VWLRIGSNRAALFLTQNRVQQSGAVFYSPASHNADISDYKLIDSFEKYETSVNSDIARMLNLRCWSLIFFWWDGKIARKNLRRADLWVEI